jgi:outer membrane receptor for monomeric catechols
MMLRWLPILASCLAGCSATGDVMVQPYQNTLVTAEPTVVTRQLMDAQNATTLPDALKNVPSVTR